MTLRKRLPLEVGPVFYCQNFRDGKAFQGKSVKAIIIPNIY